MKKSKILFYSESRESGGAEKVLGLLVRHFSDKYEVSLICAEPKLFVDIDPGKVNIVTNWIRHRFDLNNLIALKKAISSINPDLIILNLSAPYSCVHMAVITLLFFRRKFLLCIVNGVPVVGSKYPFVGTIRRHIASFFLNRANKLVFHSNASYEELKLNYSISNGNVEIIHFGFDVVAGIPEERKKELLTRHGIEDKTVIGVVSRLVPGKGIETIIEAFELMYEKTAKVVLLIIGNGRMRDQYMNNAKITRSAKRIIFTGYVDQVMDYISACDVIVMPSEYETISLALGEAMALGKPVIATKVGGVPELAGDSAILVPPNDPIAMANAAMELLNHKEKMEELGRKAKQRVLDIFTKSKMHLKYEKVFNYLLNR